MAELAQRDAPSAVSDGKADAEELGDESASLVGRVLCGKWRVERLIGRGGMGAVYEARHRNGLKVAVKVLQAERAASPRMRARFVREGYVANKVGHSGVVAVLDDDVDQESGAAFLVMELLSGETLARRVERGVVPLDAVLRVAESVLDVLAVAHEKGIVHRDVKPENVFLTHDGEVKLLDFGLARLRERDGAANNITESGAALGTLGFMAPEQARGRWDLVDGRTDVWAVGALMHRLISGRPVHRARTPNELLIAAATEPAPSVTVHARDLPASVVDLVDRALAFERDRRWPTASAMLAAVRSALEQTSPELMARSYAAADPVSSIGTDTERTNTPVTGEPAEVSSRRVDSAGSVNARERIATPGRSPGWLLGAVAVTAVAAVFIFTWQARRGIEPPGAPVRPAPVATVTSAAERSSPPPTGATSPGLPLEPAVQAAIESTSATLPPSPPATSRIRQASRRPISPVPRSAPPAHRSTALAADEEERAAPVEDPRARPARRGGDTHQSALSGKGGERAGISKGDPLDVFD